MRVVQVSCVIKCPEYVSLSVIGQSVPVFPNVPGQYWSGTNWSVWSNTDQSYAAKCPIGWELSDAISHRNILHWYTCLTQRKLNPN